MPKYAPHTLPVDASRTNNASANAERKSAPPNSPAPKIHPAILFGQHIRRERGMQGVRGYVSHVREYLSAVEYQELCSTMGIKPEPEPVPAAPQPAQMQQHALPAAPAPAPVNSANQMQMLQLLTQLLGSQGATQNAGAAPNPLLSSLLGGQPTAAPQNAGFNPAMLSQLLGGQNTAGGAGGGINPMLLAQLLGGMK